MNFISRQEGKRGQGGLKEKKEPLQKSKQGWDTGRGQLREGGLKKNLKSSDGEKPSSSKVHLISSKRRRNGKRAKNSDQKKKPMH